MACTARLCPSIFATCPTPTQRSLLVMMFPISSCTVLFHISLFVFLSLQEMCNILLSHLLCSLSSFLPFATVIGQVSEPYSRVVSTTALYSLILVLIPQPLLFHILSSLPNAAVALPMRALISWSQLLSSVSVLPRQQKVS